MACRRISGISALSSGTIPPGIDHFEGPAAPFRLAVDTVAGDAWLVGDNGAAVPVNG